MEKFIERQNFTRFSTLLMTDTDTAKRETTKRPPQLAASQGVTNSDALKLLMSSV